MILASRGRPAAAMAWRCQRGRTRANHGRFPITGARYLLLQVTDACEGAGNGNLAAVPPGYSEAVEIRFIGTAVPVPSARRELMKRRRSRHGV